jgi:hypothetical protein
VAKQDEYRKHAAALFHLATRAANYQDKGRLLLMSEAWLDLADKVSRLAGRHIATDGREDGAISHRSAIRRGRA